jgi:hypothetical protein
MAYNAVKGEFQSIPNKIFSTLLANVWFGRNYRSGKNQDAG